MPTPKDELFCRLALRQGYLTKEQAVELIRSYRDEAKVGQDIGAFALNAGWLQRPEIDQIEEAIAHRAAGHVSTSKRRVPHGGGGGGGGRQRSLHRAARPAGTAASPAQMALVAVGAIVLIGCVLFLVFKFQSGDVPTPSDNVAEKPKEVTVPDKPRKEPEPEVAKGPMVLNAEELEALTNRVAGSIMASRQGIERSPFKALEQLQAERTSMGGDQIPKLLLEQLNTQEEELRTAIRERYEELLADGRKAQAAGDNAKVGHVLEDLGFACGPEFRGKAEAELNKASN
ncbi:MAG: hypothetical protein AB7O52_09755 [Planctomycetota bacterium]